MSDSTTPPTPPERPQPQYGEYAPEGWQQPEHDTSAQPSGDSAQQPAAPAARPSAPAPGVPHNLGVGSARTPVEHPSAPQQPPALAQQPPQQLGGQQAPGQPAPRQGSAADRIITIILLVLGAFAALQFALAMLTLGTQLEIIAHTLGAEDFSVPASMTVVQSVGTITMLSLYAVALIWSVQRLRARKLAFWVPLAAGGLALILVFVFALIGIMMVPQLLELSTPENMQLLFEQFENLR